MIMQLSVILHNEYRMPVGVAPFSQYLRCVGRCVTTGCYQRKKKTEVCACDVVDAGCVIKFQLELPKAGANPFMIDQRIT